MIRRTDPLTAGPSISLADSKTRYAGGRTPTQLARDYGIVASFVALFVTLSFTTPNFLTQDNLLNVLSQNAYIGIVACGATLVIIAGGFDLSVGAMFAVAGVIAAWVAVHVGPIPGLLAGLAVGPVFGGVNGLLVTRLRINSFLATLAASLMIGGLAVAVTGGFLIDASGEASFTVIGRNDALGVPISVWLFIAVATMIGLLLARTTYGRHVFAVGGNAEAARLSGIRVGRVQALTFVISGLTASIAGLIEVSKSAAGQAEVGGDLALQAIAAVVIGGTSITGGQGAVWRTVLGVLLLALITNAFNILNVASQYQDIFTGAIILAAVALNSLSSDR